MAEQEELKHYSWVCYGVYKHLKTYEQNEYVSNKLNNSF